MNDQVRPPFAEGRLPPAFRRNVVTVEPGGTWPYIRSEWRDAIVVVESGHIALETSDGSRYAFMQGDVLWLDGLPVRFVRNPGPAPAVLVAVSRQGIDCS
jgi:quercetin dioxygenase-like cupin family protein